MTGCVKFGMTSGNGRARLGRHRKHGFTELIHLEARLPAGLAAHTERKIKIALRMSGASPVQGTEYFSDEYAVLILNEIGNWIR
jgi:hypothetical protein